MRGKPAVLLALLLLGPAEAGHYRTAAQQAPSADDRAAMPRAIDAKRDMPDDEEKTGERANRSKHACPARGPALKGFDR